MAVFDRCVKSPTGKHRWVKWMNEEHPNTERVHGPGGFVVFHCKDCGRIKK